MTIGDPSIDLTRVEDVTSAYAAYIELAEIADLGSLAAQFEPAAELKPFVAPPVGLALGR